MQIIQKLAVATAGVAINLVTIQAKPAQAARLNFIPALTATGVDTAKNLFGVDGSRIKIGVISDSFNTSQFTVNPSLDRVGNLDTYATDISNGYLPSSIQVLQDNDSPDATDEGRAMLELIHTIAPGASLAFYPYLTPATTDNPLGSFGNAIQALAADGANIIVDDIVVADEPNPPDGSINQAIESVFNQGVSYFSAGDNTGPIGTIPGHSNNLDVLTEGAVYLGNDLISPFDYKQYYQLSSDLFIQQGQLEPFSSPGDPTLPFMKPDVVAPDGLDISFNLGRTSPIDQTTDFYNFFGTSGASSFTAAVAALLLQTDPNASPSQIYAALRDTAKPLGESGFSFDSGYGLIQADKAIAALGVKTKPVPESSSVLVLLALGSLGTALLLKRHQQQKVLLKAQDSRRF